MVLIHPLWFGSTSSTRPDCTDSLLETVEAAPLSQRNLCNKPPTSCFLDKIITPTAFVNSSPGLLQPGVSVGLVSLTLKELATVQQAVANTFGVYRRVEILEPRVEATLG